MQHAGLPVDKASLVLGGKTLLDRARRTLESLCASTHVLCGTPERCARLQCGSSGVQDRVHLAGPLGALDAALADAFAEGSTWVLLMPVDLPLLSADALRAFAERALLSGSAASCMQSASRVQPVPALVRTDAGPVVQRLLEAGERKLQPALRAIAQELTPAAGLCVVDAEALGGKEQSSRWFWNVNTPDDFRAVQQSETLVTAAHQSTHG